MSQKTRIPKKNHAPNILQTTVKAFIPPPAGVSTLQIVFSKSYAYLFFRKEFIRYLYPSRGYCTESLLFFPNGVGTKKVSLLISSLLIYLLFLPFQAAMGQEGPDSRARQILAKIDDLWRADSSSSRLVMRVQTQHYSRTVELEAWSLGKEKSLVRILFPKKEQGTATLKSGNSIYTYLPKTDRTIRLTSGMMGGSWMGSHFTNDDLVKESRLSDDYDPSITYEGVRNGLSIIEFTLSPKADAPVVWGKITTTILSENHIPIESLYYDEDMVLERTIKYDQVQEMDGRLLPARLHVLPSDKEGEFTELVYKEITFGIDLDESFFSLLQLRRK